MTRDFSSRAIYARDGTLFSVSGAPDPRERLAPAETVKGWIDVFHVNRDELILEGWATGIGGDPLPSLSPPWAINRAQFTYGLIREDVAAEYPDWPQAATSGFVLRVAVPRFFTRFEFQLAFPGVSPGLQFRPKPRVQRRLWRQLLVNWAYHYPGWVKPLKQWLLRGGQGNPVSAPEIQVARVPSHLAAPTASLAGSDSGPGLEAENRGAGTVIIPVYGGLPLLERLLPKLLKDPEVAELIVIDDCSPEPGVHRFLERLARECSRMKLLRNSQNLGFVKSANRGLSLAQGNCILLNTDVDVPGGWVGRLLQPLLADGRVASVTPFTNAGTILSFPSPNQDNREFAGLEVGEIDAAFRALGESPEWIELPTGVGFCMAISGRALERVGLLDEERFGRGYGEENDWCRRAIKMGMIHVAAVNLFVRHDHGGSFREEEKQELLSRNLRKVEELHPGYESEVRHFIRRDPLQPYRGLALLFLCSRAVWKSLRVVIDHDQGGGANAYRDRELLRSSPEAGDILVFWEDHTKSYALSFRCGERREMLRFSRLNDLLVSLGRLPVDEFVINSLVFLPAPLAALGQLGVFLEERKGKLRASLVLHDYHSLCPSHNLLDRRGEYCDVAPLEACSRCLLRNRHVMVPFRTTSMDLWREAWRRILQNLEQIRAFSDVSAALFLRVYPEFAGKVLVEGHRVPPMAGSLLVQGNGTRRRLVVAAVGNLNQAKGAGVVSALVRETDLEIVVLGRMNPQPRTRPGFTLHGPYERGELGTLLARHGVTLGLVPSIWPETYNFVMDELLQLGLPVAVFDIGAPAERGRENPRVRILPYALKDDAQGLAAELRRFYESTACHRFYN